MIIFPYLLFLLHNIVLMCYNQDSLLNKETIFRINTFYFHHGHNYKSEQYIINNKDGLDCTLYAVTKR